jgi:hypothetical protein
MKNTRKKMLLSSIAMLLVALIALGSATFAWYITNATVTAEKNQFSAAAADGLVIRHTTSDAWGAKVTDLATASSLTPGALNYSALGSIFGATGQGTAFDDGTLSGALSAAAVENGQVFLVDSFYVASSSGAAKNATFTIKSGTKEGTYLNLAVYVGSTLQGVYTSATNVSSTTKIGGTSAAPTTGAGTQALTALATNTNAGTISAAVKENGGTKITVIGFADGYNPLCKNSAADVSTIDVEYSFTATQS